MSLSAEAETLICLSAMALGHSDHHPPFTRVYHLHFYYYESLSLTPTLGFQLNQIDHAADFPSILPLRIPKPVF
jgi:hypothetical protein